MPGTACIFRPGASAFWRRPSSSKSTSFQKNRKIVAGHSLCFAVEPPHLPGGFFHPCTVDDLCAVLAGCPPHDVARVRMIVLRQPTRKQRIFSRAWGRALFVRHGAPVIVLEAQSLASWRWPLALTPEWARELARLRADGHTAQRDRKRHV